MSYCPSQDWDRYINEQDEAAEAEVAFFREHRALIVSVAATLCAPIYAAMVAKGEEDQWDSSKIIDDAAEIVQIVVGRGEPQ